MPVDGTSEGLADQGDDARLLAHAQTICKALGSHPGPVGLAVSGGSDSIAMLHLMARAAPEAGLSVRAVTVDHQLRPEAAAEAAFVGRVCAGLGVPHRVLHWDHGVIGGNLMQAAGQARYGLMVDWALAQGMGDILLAHTADDQAETFLMGLSRAAGLDGLTGMRPRWGHGGVTFHRPFLNATRGALQGYLIRLGQDWVDDPSNDNDRFARVRARRSLRALRPLGITVDRLAQVVQNLSAAQGVVRQAVALAAGQAVQERAGGLILNRAVLARTEPETARRLVIAAVLWLTQARHAPREASVARLLQAMAEGRDATLAGCRVRPMGADVLILREYRAVAGIQTPTNALWDNRWRVTGPHQPDLVLRALGPSGLRACPDWRKTGLSRDAVLAAPAIWRGEALIAAPVACPGADLGAGPDAGWTAEIPASFSRFLVSH